ncbi:hypothetical protein GQ53DRAFT_303089 [Thozetella sp. PMI_491]|nr:hypothetical protein GQ53DRAFT_303089 [Thozetella sp. PMI_491]
MSQRGQQVCKAACWPSNPQTGLASISYITAPANKHNEGGLFLPNVHTKSPKQFTLSSKVYEDVLPSPPCSCIIVHSAFNAPCRWGKAGRLTVGAVPSQIVIHPVSLFAVSPLISPSVFRIRAGLPEGSSSLKGPSLGQSECSCIMHVGVYLSHPIPHKPGGLSDRLHRAHLSDGFNMKVPNAGPSHTRRLGRCTAGPAFGRRANLGKRGSGTICRLSIPPCAREAITEMSPRRQQISGASPVGLWRRPNLLPTVAGRRGSRVA